MCPNDVAPALDTAPRGAGAAQSCAGGSALVLAPARCRHILLIRCHPPPSADMVRPGTCCQGAVSKLGPWQSPSHSPSPSAPPFAHRTPPTPPRHATPTMLPRFRHTTLTRMLTLTLSLGRGLSRSLNLIIAPSLSLTLTPTFTPTLTLTLPLPLTFTAALVLLLLPLTSYLLHLTPYPLPLNSYL